MKFNPIILIFTSFISLSSVTTSHAEGEQVMISAHQIEAIAMASVSEEATHLNAILAGTEENDSYQNKSIQALLEYGKSYLDENYLFDKCIYTEGNLISLLDSKMTTGDDAAAAKRASLGNVKGLYNGKIWRLISQACINAESRFKNRLSTLTLNGRTLSFDEDTMNTATDILFFPTEAGRPSLKKGALNTLGTVLTATLFIGSSSSLIGLPLGKLLVSIVVPASSLLGVRNAILSGNPTAQSISDSIISNQNEMKIDLNTNELRFY